MPEPWRRRAHNHRQLDMSFLVPDLVAVDAGAVLVAVTFVYAKIRDRDSGDT